jgi:hypothetical protein
MASKIDVKKVPETVIASQEVPLSPDSSPQINPQSEKVPTTPTQDRRKSRGTGMVSWVPVQWPRHEHVNIMTPASRSESHMYWPSPLSMVGCFIVGTIMALGHHLYYNSLKGDLVGNPDEQQRKLRSGPFESLEKRSIVVFEQFHPDIFCPI